MLTGRAANYHDAERFVGLSCYTSPTESEHDRFSVGHTSTSVSLACGMAKARDLMGADYNVVAVIGDGSISGAVSDRIGCNLLTVLGVGEFSVGLYLTGTLGMTATLPQILFYLGLASSRSARRSSSLRTTR